MISTVRNQVGVAAIGVALFALACSALFWSRMWLSDHPLKDISPEHPPLYLPDVRYVRGVTLGFDTLASKILWFNTVNYFGKQFAGQHDYRWLGSMCDLVTELDPKGRHVFEFCATLLSWVAKDPEKSVYILNRGIEQEPNYWRYRYLRAFNYWYFLNDEQKAKDEMLQASNCPDAPPFLLTLSSSMIAKDGGPAVARQFLEDLVSNTADPNAKKLFGRKLKQAKLAEMTQKLTAVVNEFRQQQGRNPSSLEELVEHGVLTSVPQDPWKGKYYLNENGEVKTTSNKVARQFAIRTAQTGVAKHEFLEDE